MARLAAPIAGAGLAGAAEEGVEQAVGADPLSLEGMAKAGGYQAGMEAAGQAVAWPIKAVGRRVMASGVGKKISQGLTDALDAVNARLQQYRPSVTPSQAGKLADEVIQGPSKAVKDQLGRDVEAAAVQGPPIPTKPLKDRLADLSAQVTPMASHQQMPKIAGFTPAQTQALVAKNPSLMLPPDHPLPTILAKVEEAIGGSTEIAFEDAHKIKRLLDDAVNWDSPARKQVQQITKGFR